MHTSNRNSFLGCDMLTQFELYMCWFVRIILMCMVLCSTNSPALSHWNWFILPVISKNALGHKCSMCHINGEVNLLCQRITFNWSFLLHMISWRIFLLISSLHRVLGRRINPLLHHPGNGKDSRAPLTTHRLWVTRRGNLPAWSWKPSWSGLPRLFEMVLYTSIILCWHWIAFQV